MRSMCITHEIVHESYEKTYEKHMKKMLPDILIIRLFRKAPLFTGLLVSVLDPNFSDNCITVRQCIDL
jgi:hypothetical protein